MILQEVCAVYINKCLLHKPLVKNLSLPRQDDGTWSIKYVLRVSRDFQVRCGSTAGLSTAV
jgi:hypothetical protein